MHTLIQCARQHVLLSLLAADALSLVTPTGQLRGSTCLAACRQKLQGGSGWDAVCHFAGWQPARRLGSVGAAQHEPLHIFYL